MHFPKVGFLASLLVSTFGCDPSWPRGRHPPEDPAEVPVTVRADPSAEGAIAPVLRISLGGGIDPNAEAILVHGTISEGQLRSFEDGVPSAAMLSRSFAVTTWWEGNLLLVRPHVPLPAGETVSVAWSLPLGSAPLVVGSATPLLRRVWPPPGPHGQVVAVYCDDTKRLSIPASTDDHMDPGAVPAQLLRGATPSGRAAHCVRLSPERIAGVAHPPVTVGGIPIDPTPLDYQDAPPDPIDRVACEVDEFPFGPGCAQVLDDRLKLRPPEVPLLWVLSVEDQDAVVTSEGEAFVWGGLPPSSLLSVEVFTADQSGSVKIATESIRTLAPMAHLVINEVYANPIGPEPSQEWIEIVNDGTENAELEGVRIIDVGGETVLPAAKLEPGAFALIVRDDFDPGSEYDPPPAAGVLLVRVPALGKNGLGNAGEPLRLEDASGTVLSRSSAKKCEAGESAARTTPKGSDVLKTGVPTPGRPNLLED